MESSASAEEWMEPFRVGTLLIPTSTLTILTVGSQFRFHVGPGIVTGHVLGY